WKSGASAPRKSPKWMRALAPRTPVSAPPVCTNKIGAQPKGPAPPFIYSLFSEYQTTRGLLGHASALYLPHGTNNLRQKRDVWGLDKFSGGLLAQSG
ncbi:MAG: hypothetical protein WBV98_25245, partial [Candidatus Sulfotelmatobacter sp.]